MTTSNISRYCLCAIIMLASATRLHGMELLINPIIKGISWLSAPITYYFSKPKEPTQKILKAINGEYPYNAANKATIDKIEEFFKEITIPDITSADEDKKQFARDLVTLDKTLAINRHPIDSELLRLRGTRWQTMPLMGGELCVACAAFEWCQFFYGCHKNDGERIGAGLWAIGATIYGGKLIYDGSIYKYTNLTKRKAVYDFIENQLNSKAREFCNTHNNNRKLKDQFPTLYSSYIIATNRT